MVGLVVILALLLAVEAVVVLVLQEPQVLAAAEGMAVMVKHHQLQAHL
jgi:hypothetical protein